MSNGSNFKYAYGCTVTKAVEYELVCAMVRGLCVESAVAAVKNGDSLERSTEGFYISSVMDKATRNISNVVKRAVREVEKRTEYEYVSTSDVVANAVENKKINKLEYLAPNGTRFFGNSVSHIIANMKLEDYVVVK